jgi:hypothetical protein
MRFIRGLDGLIIVAVALAGCAVGFPISSNDIGSPPPNSARLIIYRPSGPMLVFRSPSIDVNGVSACDLPRGAGFKKDVGSGEVTVAAHLWDIPETSSLSLMAEPGKIYYIRVRVAGEASPGAVGGLFGMGTNPAQASPGQTGPFELDFTDEATALASEVGLTDADGKIAC